MKVKLSHFISFILLKKQMLFNFVTNFYMWCEV